MKVFEGHINGKKYNSSEKYAEDLGKFLKSGESFTANSSYKEESDNSDKESSEDFDCIDWSTTKELAEKFKELFGYDCNCENDKSQALEKLNAFESVDPDEIFYHDNELYTDRLITGDPQKDEKLLKDDEKFREDFLKKIVECSKKFEKDDIEYVIDLYKNAIEDIACDAEDNEEIVKDADIEEVEKHLNTLKHRKAIQTGARKVFDSYTDYMKTVIDKLEIIKDSKEDSCKCDDDCCDDCCDCKNKKEELNVDFSDLKDTFNKLFGEIFGNSK